MNQRDMATGMILILGGVGVAYITIRRLWPLVLLSLFYPWDVCPTSSSSGATPTPSNLIPSQTTPPNQPTSIVPTTGSQTVTPQTITTVGNNPNPFANGAGGSGVTIITTGNSEPTNPPQTQPLAPAANWTSVGAKVGIMGILSTIGNGLLDILGGVA